MLPGVNAHNWNMRAIDNVLVGLGDDVEGASVLVLDNPSPARTLDAGELAIDVGNELVKGAVLGLDSLTES